MNPTLLFEALKGVVTWLCPPASTWFDQTALAYVTLPGLALELIVEFDRKVRSLMNVKLTSE